MTATATLDALSAEVTAALGGSWYQFPDVEMLDSAAALFPSPEWRNTRGGWTRQPGDPDAWREFTERREGPWPTLQLAPGVLKYTRADVNRFERTGERLTLRHIKTFGRGEDAEQTISRGVVRMWSGKSRNNLKVKVASLDLAQLVEDGTPVLLTLTVPGPWLNVTPTAAAAAAAFRRFERKWSRRWGRMRCIWKREFQRRGAPHWHLWTTIPAGVDHDEFRAWLSTAWADCLHWFEGGDETTLQRGSAHDYRLSVAAGTGVDFTTAERMRSPQLLVAYFLKESLGGEGKAYQNKPPAEWEGQSTGRYWGVRGLKMVTAAVCIDPRHATRVWRAIRKWREAQGIKVRRRVQRVNQTTGEVSTRTVYRRVNHRGPAGFVLVADGSEFASQLARYVTQLAESPPS